MLLNHFQTTFNYVADIHAPIQGRKVGKMNAPWLTDAIKESMNHRDYLKEKAIKTNSSVHHNVYKCIRNEINKRIIHAKCDYYVTCVDKNRNNTNQMGSILKPIYNIRIIN